MTDGQEWAAPDSGGSAADGSTRPPASPGAPDQHPPQQPPPSFQPAQGGIPGPHGPQPPGPDPYGQQQYGYGGPPGHGQPWANTAPKPGIIPLRPLRLSEILDGAVTYMRRNPRSVVGLSFIVALVSESIVALVSYFFLVDSLRALADPTQAPATPEAALAPYADLIPTVIVVSFGVLVLNGMLTAVVGRAVLGGAVSIGQAWRDVLPRLHVLLATTLLTMVLALLAMAVPLSPFIVSLLIDAPLAIKAIAGGLGFLAAIVALIWVAVTFIFATSAVVLEGAGVFSALARSAQLIKNAWWRTLGISLLAQLIASMIGGAVQVPFGIGAAAVLLTGGPEAGDGTYALYLTIQAIGGIIVGTVIYPFGSGVTALLYVDRRVRREGLDLELQTSSQRYQGVDLSREQLVEVWRPATMAPAAAGAGTPPGTGGGP
jgi:hypothetical protein